MGRYVIPVAGQVRARLPFLWLLFGAACQGRSAEVGVPVASPVEPLAGLTEAQTARFQRGREEFLEVDTAIEGLGPLFNAASCSHCHALGGVGGGGVARVTRSVCVDAEGVVSEPSGGTLIPLFSTRPELSAAAPPRDCDTHTVQRRSTPLFGAGLMEAIADEELEWVASQQAVAIRGRVAWIEDAGTGELRAGRFGWKAQQATLRTFAGDAYRNELGITNELFPDELAPGGDLALLAAMDPIEDPEADVGAIDALADFMRFLPPLSVGDSSVLGAELFDSIGCAGCHVPVLHAAETADIVAQGVPLYSDLLLHDVGTGDLIVQGAADGRELRTAPLWGLRFAPHLLHDGRASTVSEAILAHAGQATASRQAFVELLSSEQAELLSFLSAL
ncbi:MAG: hypothetical protein RL033_3695 [Pseudomonadota bacterium]